MKINNVLIFILLITLFIFFVKIYKEGYTNEMYNADIVNKQNTIDKIATLKSNLTKKDYSIYNTETAAMAVQQWNLFIIIGGVTLILLGGTIKYVIS